MDKRAAETIIVNMEPKHVAQVAEIERGSFGRGNTQKSYEVWTEKSYIEDLQEDACVYICAVADESENAEVIGYCGMRTVLDEGHITKIAVKKEYRRLGIGERLLSELLRIGSENKITFYELEVRKSNIEAQKLYEKYGFELKGARLGYYSDNGEDAYIYIKGAMT